MQIQEWYYLHSTTKLLANKATSISIYIICSLRLELGLSKLKRPRDMIVDWAHKEATYRARMHEFLLSSPDCALAGFWRVC